MKTILILCLALMTGIVFAAPMHRPYRKPVKPVPVETPQHRPISWKTVAAGGVAAGTIISAYKVSNGIEEGIKTVAKEKPEVIPQTFAVITWPVRWALLILFIVCGCWIAKKLLDR